MRRFLDLPWPLPEKAQNPAQQVYRPDEPLQDFMAGFAFCGPLQSNVESIGTRFLNRATDGVNRGMEAAQTQQTKPTGAGVDVWADGTSAEHIQRMKIIWEHLLNSSDGGREIADRSCCFRCWLAKRSRTSSCMAASRPRTSCWKSRWSLRRTAWSWARLPKSLCWTWQTTARIGS